MKFFTLAPILLATTTAFAIHLPPQDAASPLACSAVNQRCDANRSCCSGLFCNIGTLGGTFGVSFKRDPKLLLTHTTFQDLRKDMKTRGCVVKVRMQLGGMEYEMRQSYFLSCSTTLTSAKVSPQCD